MKKFLITTIILLAALIGAWHFFIRPALDSIPSINESTKTCLITGASSGIGLEITRDMIKRGWQVIGVARRENTLKTIAQELGSSFIPFVCDVSNPAQVHATSEEIKAAQLKPTLFFLNAGTGDTETPFQQLLDLHQRTFATNYFGVISWIDEWLPAVKTFGGGTFVGTSSMASFFSGPGAAGYSASKAALNEAFRSLRLQYRHENIGFAIVLPGPVKTEMIKSKKELPMMQAPEETAAYIVEQVFRQKKQIEPSWFYSCVMRILAWLPDTITEKIIA